jgi:probable DNA metabolism protein
MVDYLYDGTFEGFLTCVYHHYATEKASGIYPTESYQPNMLVESKVVQSDEVLAQRVYTGIGHKISAFDLERVYKVFLSTCAEKENILLHYLQLGFKMGGDISRLHGNPIVFDVQKVDRQVAFEVHRYKGLIRFTVLANGVMYSPIEPDHDVLELLADHFTVRFRDDPFIIHDKTRNKAMIASVGQWYICEFTESVLLDKAKEELDYQRLWRNYFDTIAIKERTNPKCQKNFMPVRYWKHLTEMAPDFSEHPQT